MRALLWLLAAAACGVLAAQASMHLWPPRDDGGGKEDTHKW